MKIRNILLALALLAAATSPAFAAFGPAGVSSMGIYTTDNVASFVVSGYCNQFGTCGTPTLTLNGSTSGASILQAPATGGGTLTLPAGTGTLDSASSTATLTNKTLTSPVINNPTITGPIPVACGATCTASAGNTYLLNTAAGSVGTLPAATGTGSFVKFRISVAVSSNANKVLTSPITDTIIGTAIGENAGTAKVFVGNASTYHSIQMPFAGTQPSGGFIGDQITCQDIASAVWACDINYQAGTTPTTPYSASTT